MSQGILITGTSSGFGRLMADAAARRRAPASASPAIARLPIARLPIARWIAVAYRAVSSLAAVSTGRHARFNC